MSRITANEFDSVIDPCVLHVRPRRSTHAFGDVYADDASSGADGTGQRDERFARAKSHVED